MEGDVEHRDHEEPDSARGDHAGEDRGADIVAADLGGALRDDQRIDAKDEGERGHHHGAKPHPRAEHRGFPNVHALFAPVLGEFDDQDAVLGGHRDQHDEPDLGIEVEREVKNQDSEKRPQHPDRHRQQYRDRDHPAFVETDEKEKREQHGEPQDRAGLPGSRELLIGGPGPFIAVARRQGFV